MTNFFQEKPSITSHWNKFLHVSTRSVSKHLVKYYELVDAKDICKVLDLTNLDKCLTQNKFNNLDLVKAIGIPSKETFWAGKSIKCCH